jgi:hypothetical protein
MAIQSPVQQQTVPPASKMPAPQGPDSGHGPEPDGPERPFTTELLFDFEDGKKLEPPKRQPVEITPELARVFVRAARVARPQEPPLQFSSLLVAMLVDEDEWLRLHFDQSEVNFQAIESKRPYASLTPHPDDASRLGPSYLASVSARAALEEAARIARGCTGRNTIDLRHLCAAYPVLPKWHLDDFKAFQIDRLQWARALGAEMAGRFPHERGYWSTYADRASPVPLTSFSADVYTEEDLLGIDRGVDALALLVASTRTATPLAIGVFGPWGSGKTFYMRHLQKRIVRLRHEEQDRIVKWKAAREQGSASEDDAPLYYGEVAQVEFNAWHYNEANLVASLVEHLFRNLRVAPDEKDDELDKRRAVMLGKLGGLKGELTTIDQSIEAARQRVEAAQADVRQASKAAEQARQVVQDKAGEMATHRAKLEDERSHMDEALRAVRLEPDQVAADDVIAVALGPLAPLLEQIRGTITGLKDKAFDWAAFFDRLVSPRGLAVVGLCIAAPAVLWFAKALEGQWALLTGSVATAVAGFGNALEVLRRRRAAFEAKLEALEAEGKRRVETARQKLEAEHGARVAAAQGRLDAVKGELDAQRRALGDREARLVQAASELAARAADHDECVARRVEAEEAARAAQAELERLSSALLLEEFIKDRASTDEYRKQLGFLALVRRDIERLSELIDKANKRWMDPRNKDPAPLLNRIVLYIDDLDRCKESTVLEVLEAVHLLLAFPLFVCAVAVDPRWVEKCLRLARRQLFIEAQEALPGGAAGEALLPPALPHGLGGVSIDGAPGAPATVADYLEKIFQIPIWMTPIEPRARAGLVNSLLGPTATPRPLRIAQEGEEDKAPAPQPQRDPLNAFEALLEQARETPDPLRVTAEEAAYIEELAPLLSDRPRALKRLVNVYRLLKASLPDLERANFVRREVPSSGYRICLTQLALFTSHPRVAPALLAALGPGGDGGHGGNGVAVPLPSAQTLQSWFDALDPPRDAMLERAIELIPDRGTLLIDEFRRWLPQTSRYLFNRNG